MRAVVAFANTAGGTIVIGVDDRTRRVRGIKDQVLVAEQAANLISTLIAPRGVPNIRVYPWRKTYWSPSMRDGTTEGTAGDI
jgi:ATP-dependent DNA helicase RecG